MPEVLHRGLTPERWNKFPLEQRLGMIVSEFARIIELASDNGRTVVQRCYQRARELLIWTLESVPAEEPLAARLEEAIRAIDAADVERWAAARLTEHAEGLSVMVSAERDRVPRGQGEA